MIEMIKAEISEALARKISEKVVEI